MKNTSNIVNDVVKINPSLHLLHYTHGKQQSIHGQDLHSDYVGTFFGKMFLIIYNTYSKWIDAYPVNQPRCEITISKLENTFAIHGLPQILVTNNTLCFTSLKFKEYIKQNGIKHVTSAPYHPSSNGSAERTVQTFKKSLKKTSEENKAENMDKNVNTFLFGYRITPHNVPSKLLRNRILRNKFKPSMQQRILPKEEAAIVNSSNMKIRTFTLGEKVLAETIVIL